MFYHVLPNYQHQKSLLLSFFGGIPRPVPVVPVGPGSSAPNSSREAEASKNAIPSLKPRPQLQWRASRPDSSGGCLVSVMFLG